MSAFNFRYSCLFVVFFSVCGLNAQLERGTSILSTGSNLTVLSTQQALPLSSDFLLISAGVGGEGVVLFSPNLSVMASDYIQFGVSGVFGSNPTGRNGSVRSIIPNLRFYTASPEEARFFVGGAVQFLGFDIGRNSSRSTSYFPSMGLSLPGSPGFRITPEVGYLLGKEINNQFLASVQVEFLLGKEKVAEAEFEGGGYREGTLMFGTGSISYGVLGEGGGSLFSFQPEVHLFISRTTALGLRARIISSSGRFLSGSQSTYGITLRQMLSTPRRLSFFLQLGSDYNSQSSSSLSFDAAVGGLYFLRQRTALEFGLSGVYNRDQGSIFGPTLGGRFFVGGK